MMEYAKSVLGINISGTFFSNILPDCDVGFQSLYTIFMGSKLKHLHDPFNPIVSHGFSLTTNVNLFV